MKILIAMSAIAGAGKSTYAKHYKMNHQDENVVIVSSDGIRKELTGVYNNLNFEKEVWDLYFKRINTLRDANDDVVIIADSTNIYNKFRQQLGVIPGFDKKILVVITKDLELCFEYALNTSGAVAIRYPKLTCPTEIEEFKTPVKEGKGILVKGSTIVIPGSLSGLLLPTGSNTHPTNIDVISNEAINKYFFIYSSH